MNWKLRAEEVEYQLRPGDPWPRDEERPSTVASNIPTATGEPSEESSTPPAEDNDDEGNDSGLSTGAIAGTAVGGVLALIILGLSIFYCGRRGGVKVFFTRETPASSLEAQFPRYATPAAMEAPFRPPRTPGTENWRPTMDYQGNTIARTVSPETSMYQQSLPAMSPYKADSGRGHLSVPSGTPPAAYEQRHVASF